MCTKCILDYVSFSDNKLLQEKSKYVIPEVFFCYHLVQRIADVGSTVLSG